MEPWAYASEGRGFLCPEEIDDPFDAHPKDRRTLSGCNRMSVESVMELGFSQMPRSPFYDVNTSTIRSGEFVIDSGEILESYASTRPSNSAMDSMSTHCNSIVEANARGSAQIDLKLGGVAVRGDIGKSKFLTDGFMLSSGSSNVHAKKARTSSTRSQGVFCQVYGCNKDLGSLKDYNKRHKVCEVHSKSPRVIVNGIEQRFCQQCSRFHLLSEFDDGKRSCRKRLADHNERRRKPQYITLSGRTHKLLQSYKGEVYIPERYEQANWQKHLKLEEESIHNLPPIVTPATNKQLLPTSIFHHYSNIIPNAARISPLCNEDFSACDTASTVYNSREMSLSSCALSLLSAESQGLSRLARDNMVRSLSNHSIESIVPSGSHWSKVNSTRLNQTTSHMVSSALHSADLQAKAGGDLFNTKLSLSSEEGSTVDLLQLSSHLQRVEQQRSFMQVKNEDDDICSFPSAY